MSGMVYCKCYTTMYLPYGEDCRWCIKQMKEEQAESVYNKRL